MMDCLTFDLMGMNAFFKNPEQNIGTEFSFEHIHKPALLGILGAILGLEGKYSISKSDMICLPEYYVKLKGIKIAIQPKLPIFDKHIETITNTTGFANKFSTQIIKRKILQNVQWKIYLIQNNTNLELWKKLIHLLMNHESEYPIYLGNNNYKANIRNVENIQLVNDMVKYNEVLINSIFPKKIMQENYQECIDEEITPYDLSIYYPKELNRYNLYIYDWFEYTNCLLDIEKNYVGNIYNYEGNNLYFL
jgi:CRISPR-associated protein Cas5h